MLSAEASLQLEGSPRLSKLPAWKKCEFSGNSVGRGCVGRGCSPPYLEMELFICYDYHCYQAAAVAVAVAAVMAVVFVVVVAVAMADLLLWWQPQPTQRQRQQQQQQQKQLQRQRPPPMMENALDLDERAVVGADDGHQPERDQGEAHQGEAAHEVLARHPDGGVQVLLPQRRPPARVLAADLPLRLVVRQLRPVLLLQHLLHARALAGAVPVRVYNYSLIPLCFWNARQNPQETPHHCFTKKKKKRKKKTTTHRCGCRATWCAEELLS
jgi:hypothetical protein